MEARLGIHSAYIGIPRGGFLLETDVAYLFES